jgi:uncharacterized protein (TIGR02145 family)
MKYLVAILLATLSLNALSQIPDFVPTEGLVAWWLMDGNGNDESGFSHHGQNFGATATANRWGEEEKALYFNSQSYLVVDHTNELNIPTGSDLTWSIWMRPEPDNEGGSAFEKWAGSDSQNRSQLLLRINNDADYFHCNAWCNYTSVAPMDADVVPNEWHHVILRTSNQHTELFLNGVLVDSSDVELSGCTNSTNLFIGKRNALSGNTRAFKGAIDDFGIWNRALTDEEITALFEGALPVVGCTDSEACNFNVDATVEDESCAYSGCNDASACNFNGADLCDIDCVYPAIGEDCTAGEGFCGPGTYWDDASQTCQVTIPGDVDFNGCVSVEDLLGSLAIYNLCFDAEEIAFTCGVDVVNYDGYDYQTVQIGDQCWFAENLRCTHYSDGSEIPLLLSTEEWESQSGPALTFRSDSAQTVLWGAYYNWESLVQESSVCPIGWHAPSHLEWSALEIAVGMDEEAAVNFGFRGGIPEVPIALSTTGTNSSGFSAVGAGFRYEHGGWDPNYTAFWTTTEVANPLNAVSRKLFYLQNITAVPDLKTWGLSVRCLRDDE